MTDTESLHFEALMGEIRTHLDTIRTQVERANERLDAIIKAQPAELWNVQQAAAHLGVCAGRIRKACADGTLPHTRTSERGHFQILSSDAVAWGRGQV